MFSENIYFNLNVGGGLGVFGGVKWKAKTYPSLTLAEI